MERTDLVLIGLGVVAVLVTAVAYTGSSRWAPEETVSFVTSSSPLAAQGPTEATGSGARFNWTVPDNATSAVLTADVAFSGQAVQGGSATVTVRIRLPDGTYAPDRVMAMPIPQGSTSATLAIDGLNVTWAQVPAEARDVKGAQPEPLAWALPLEVLVVVQPPSDVPLADYSFQASIEGQVTAYRAD